MVKSHTGWATFFQQAVAFRYTSSVGALPKAACCSSAAAARDSVFPLPGMVMLPWPPLPQPAVSENSAGVSAPPPTRLMTAMVLSSARIAPLVTPRPVFRC